MRIVVQRVRNAEVAVPDQGYKAQIGHGLLVLAAFIDEDTAEDLEWTARKLVAMRIFGDSEGVMNLSVRMSEEKLWSSVNLLCMHPL